MALRFNLFSPNTVRRFPDSQIHLIRPKSRVIIRCASNFSDAELASDLAKEVSKMNTRLAQKKEAMEKSKEILIRDFSQFLNLKEDEVKKKWKKLNEEEKSGLVKGFVDEWGVNFQPLSARSVKGMIEEYLQEEKPSSPSYDLFPGLKRIMGFSQDN